MLTKFLSQPVCHRTNIFCGYLIGPTRRYIHYPIMGPTMLLCKYCIRCLIIGPTLYSLPDHRCDELCIRYLIIGPTVGSLPNQGTNNAFV